MNTQNTTAALLARPLGLPEIMAITVLRILNNDGNIIIKNIVTMAEYGVDFSIGAFRCSIRKISASRYEFLRLAPTTTHSIEFNRSDIVGEGRLRLMELLVNTFR